MHRTRSAFIVSPHLYQPFTDNRKWIEPAGRALSGQSIDGAPVANTKIIVVISMKQTAYIASERMGIQCSIRPTRKQCQSISFRVEELLI